MLQPQSSAKDHVTNRWLMDPFCLPGDELYAGVATDLMGRDFTIFRSLGKRPSIRTEQHDSRWLNGPCVCVCVSTSVTVLSCSEWNSLEK